MSNKCVKCGVAIEAPYDTCSRCSVAHLMTVESSEPAAEASTVSVPVRRKRTLPNSCLLGTLLFIPVMAIAAMLVHFHLKNQAELDERMSQKRLQLGGSSQPLSNETMVKMMTAYVKKQAPGVVTTVTSANGDVMTVGVTTGWRQLNQDRKNEFTNAWLKQWKYLGGSSMVIEAVQNGTDEK